MRALVDEELPSITVLVPLYREAAIVPVLLHAIANFDYPAIKLDVKILLEEEDEETAAAVRAARPPEHFKIVRVPDAKPKTKPKACNYGLIEATGELLVIYDAEDIPDRDQLKKCVVAFRNAPDDVACIQAKLNYFNPYAEPADQLVHARIQPVVRSLPARPGRHARADPARRHLELLHHRAARRGRARGTRTTSRRTRTSASGSSNSGYRTAILDSTTYEEANTRYGNWIRQRSRWIKGYMQTWLVHNRNPCASGASSARGTSGASRRRSAAPSR